MPCEPKWGGHNSMSRPALNWPVLCPIQLLRAWVGLGPSSGWKKKIGPTSIKETWPYWTAMPSFIISSMSGLQVHGFFFWARIASHATLVENEATKKRRNHGHKKGDRKEFKRLFGILFLYFFLTEIMKISFFLTETIWSCLARFFLRDCFQKKYILKNLYFKEKMLLVFLF